MWMKVDSWRKLFLQRTWPQSISQPFRRLHLKSKAVSDKQCPHHIRLPGDHRSIQSKVFELFRSVARRYHVGRRVQTFGLCPYLFSTGYPLSSNSSWGTADSANSPPSRRKPPRDSWSRYSPRWPCNFSISRLKIRLCTLDQWDKNNNENNTNKHILSWIQLK